MAGKNGISMKERGATVESLKDLYVVQNMSLEKIGKTFGVGEAKVKKWLLESNIPLRGRTSKYMFNENYFDDIDTEEKAYWLGFVWCDASVIQSGTNLALKVSLSEVDDAHLYKLKKAFDAEQPISYYKTTGFESKNREARLLLSNSYLGGVLREKYGMIPHRNDPSLLIDAIPKHFIRHFLRGVYDADGSLTLYHVQEKDCKNPTMKMCLQIYTNEKLIDFIQEHFVEVGLRVGKTKTIKRHKDRDGSSTGLNISGTNQAVRILEYLYEGSNIYLDRKYEKFLEMQEARRNLRATSRARNQYSV